jgi:hypothetical protein
VTTSELINLAQADGIELRLEESGEVKVEVFEDLVPVWIPRLREHKPAIAQILQERENGVLAWLRQNCTRAARVSINSDVLYREYRVWAVNTAVSRESFFRVLSAKGYAERRGMVDGLCLANDFLAAMHDERMEAM